MEGLENACKFGRWWFFGEIRQEFLLIPFDMVVSWQEKQIILWWFFLQDLEAAGSRRQKLSTEEVGALAKHISWKEQEVLQKCTKTQVNVNPNVLDVKKAANLEAGLLSQLICWFLSHDLWLMIFIASWAVLGCFLVGVWEGHVPPQDVCVSCSWPQKIMFFVDGRIAAPAEIENFERSEICLNILPCRISSIVSISLLFGNGNWWFRSGVFNTIKISIPCSPFTFFDYTIHGILSSP